MSSGSVITLSLANLSPSLYVSLLLSRALSLSFPGSLLPRAAHSQMFLTST